MGLINVRRDIQALATVAIASCLLGGCGFINRHFHKENDAYKTSVQEHPLEVPPDLDKPNTAAALSIPQPSAATASADASSAPAGVAAPAGSGTVVSAPTEPMAPAIMSDDALHVQDSVDSVWNRVGLAVERSGAATILARDEAGRSYTSRPSAKPSPSRAGSRRRSRSAWPRATKTAEVRLKLRVTAEGNGSKVGVEGASDDASRAAAQALLNTLKQRLS